MALKSGKPTTLKSQKELAIESVKNIDNETHQQIKTQRFNVDIPESLHNNIKIQAIREGLKLNTLAIKVFEEYLNKKTHNE
ncbi:MAG: toxin-antitoxin system HicB family antitoxin [Methylococcales bacterium]